MNARLTTLLRAPHVAYDRLGEPRRTLSFLALLTPMVLLMVVLNARYPTLTPFIGIAYCLILLIWRRWYLLSDLS